MDKLVYRLKVTIKDINPPIWRRILIPTEATFWELHLAIQDAFEWEDYHLHEFYIGRVWDRNSIRIKLPHPDDEDFEDEVPPENESTTILSKYISKKSPMTYVYDFGDGWEHKIVLEKEFPRSLRTIYPQVIAGKRSSPVEDCGGPGGYEELMEAIDHKKHPRHKETLEWLAMEEGEKMDWEHFDPKEIVFRNPKTEFRKYLRAINK